MKLLKYKKIFSVLIILIGLLVLASPLQATTLNDESAVGVKNQAKAFSLSAGFAETGGASGVSDIIARVIVIALSLLAIIFIVIIIISGFRWMTAGGNEEAISKSKKYISNAIIGLIIVLAAYAITWFIFTYLPFEGPSSTPSGGGGGTN